MKKISENDTNFIGDLGQAVRTNPLSAALIGMGVLWLFAGNRGVEKAGEFVKGASGFDGIPDAAGNVVQAADSTLRSRVDSVGERAKSAKDSLQHQGADALDNVARIGHEQLAAASEYAVSIPKQGAEKFNAVRSNLNDLLTAQPLALGAIGIAIGAGIAAALPPSEVEATYLGETSDAVKSKAVRFVAEQTDRATAVIENVMEESRREGLTLAGAQDAARDIASKVGRVVDTAKQGISERATLTKFSS